MQEHTALTIAIYATTLRSYLVSQALPAIPYGVAFKTIQRLAAVLLIAFITSITARLAIAQQPTQSALTGAGGNRVALASSTHPATRAASDLGRLAGDVAMDRMLLVLAGSENQEHGLRELLDNPAYLQRASQVGEQVRQEDGVRAACDALEGLLRVAQPAGAGLAP